MKTYEGDEIAYEILEDAEIIREYEKGKKYMGDNGCPPPKVCKGFKPSGIRVIHYEN